MWSYFLLRCSRLHIHAHICCVTPTSVPSTAHYTDTQAPLKAHAIDRSPSLFSPTNTMAIPATTSVKNEGHAHRGLAAVAASDKEAPRAGGAVGQGWFGSHNVPSDWDIYDYLGFGMKVRRKWLSFLGVGGEWGIRHPLIWSHNTKSHHTMTHNP